MAGSCPARRPAPFPQAASPAGLSDFFQNFPTQSWPMRTIDWILRILAAVILLQTLYFKFTGAPESIYIFETLGMEPIGRYGSGIAELISAILLLVPRTVVLGALGGALVMLGAIASHLGPLGIEVQADGGLLFGLACTVLGCCMVLLRWRWSQLKTFLPGQSNQ